MFNISRLFGRKNSPPPLDDLARGWIEAQLRWLRHEFGVDRLIEAPVIKPTEKFFPDPYDRSEAAVRAMLDRVCGYMDVSPAIVELQLYDESNRPEFVNDEGHLLGGTAGTYREGNDRFVIRLEKNQCDAPMDLVGTMAHELSHLRLLGESRIDPERFDNELLTDLTAVFFGFGIFLANSPRHWHSDLTTWPGTSVRRPEYMTLPMYGYALAMIAEIRFEERPAWQKHLRRDTRSEFRTAAAYLRSRGAT